MVIHTPNPLLERLARIRYGLLNNRGRAGHKVPVIYRQRRWYRHDPQGRVLRVARTYFEVMQP